MATNAEAKQAEINRLNSALVAIGGNAMLWSYTVSLNTLELVIGDVHGKANVVIALAGCEYISGPTTWSQQKLTVGFEPSQHGWTFEVADAAVNFKATSKGLSWRSNFNVLDAKSLMYPLQQS